MKYKSLIFMFAMCFSISVFAQLQPVTSYEGDLYFVPAKLTKKGKAFLYSFYDSYQESKTWFTVFDPDLNVVAQSEIKDDTITYQSRTITEQRTFFYPQVQTRASSENEGYFLDDWHVTSDVTTMEKFSNHSIMSPEIYDDENQYHSRSLYLSQTLFDDDDEFEYICEHYEVMPLSYNQADDGTGYTVITEDRCINGEYFDEMISQYYDTERAGYIFVIARYKIYGGLKCTGTDVCRIDGTVKKHIEGLTYFSSAIAINGNYYVSAYDNDSQKRCLYKIATATSDILKVAELTKETGDNATYNFSGIRVNPNTKGIVIKNGVKRLNK